MLNLQLSSTPVAKAEMLIRKPVAEVFNAFVDPDITTKFWFTKSSGRLEPGKTVQWTWEMYGVSSEATVKAFEPQKRIILEWSGNSSSTTVEWTFTPRESRSTFVSITHSGFAGSADDMVKAVVDSTEGFTLVLSGLKALLEHGIRLNLVPDRHPDAIVKR
jgi:uncharacterized protein YndB with AHSA1/START domain